MRETSLEVDSSCLMIKILQFEKAFSVVFLYSQPLNMKFSLAAYSSIATGYEWFTSRV